MSWLRLIRWPNLLILALTMLLLQWRVSLELTSQTQIGAPISNTIFLLLVLMTLISTAGGYIVNDFFDYKIDQINKPDKVIITKSVTSRRAKRIYLLLIISGAFLSSFLSSHTGLWGITILYNLVTILLFAYAKIWKRKTFVGNVVVALLCAFVPLLLCYVNWNVIVLLDADSAFSLNVLFLAFMAFSFFVTLYREIIKDIEDLEGDEAYGSRTLPIVYGIRKAKAMAGSNGVILILGIIYLEFVISGNNGFTKSMFFSLPLILIFCYSLYRLAKAEVKRDFKFISSVLKVSMLLGMIWLSVGTA